MATIVLQVLIEVENPSDTAGYEIAEEVKELLSNSGELSADFALQFGITGVTVVFEDIV